jgi:hypothetical protein
MRRLPRSASLGAGSVEEIYAERFSHPERGPILPFSACLAENPGWLKTENPGVSRGDVRRMTSRIRYYFKIFAAFFS